MRKVLVVIDMQRDFIDGALGTPEAKAIVPEVVRRIDTAKAEGREVFFTQDTHDAARYLSTSEGRHLPVLHCLKGTPGWALHEDIAPYAQNAIEKQTFGLLDLAQTIGRDTQEDGADLDIAICGLCTDICVIINALLLRAHFPEAEIRVYAGACAGVTPGGHDAALTVMKACQIEIE